MSRVTLFGVNSSGGAHRGVEVDGVHVLVQCNGADEQDAVDSVARRIGSLRATEAALDKARRERDDLRFKVAHLSGEDRVPSLFGDAFVRVDGQGAVWLLGDRAKGWAAYGLRFASWEELAHERPDVRPCGCGHDDHGAYVVMRSMTAEVAS